MLNAIVRILLASVRGVIPSQQIDVSLQTGPRGRLWVTVRAKSRRSTTWIWLDRKRLESLYLSVERAYLIVDQAEREKRRGEAPDLERLKEIIERGGEE